MFPARKADQYHKFFYYLAIGLFLSLPAQLSCLADEDSPHLMINELQISGGSGETENDFVEIYNPTNASINLKGHRLVKRTKTGTSDTSIKSWTSDTIIASKNYHLWANSKDGYSKNIGADSETSQTISSDNGIALRKGAENTGEIIDSVGWGGCQNSFVENAAFPDNPPEDKSIERKDFKDSNDNSSDFSIKTTPSPTASKPVNPTPDPSTPPTPPETPEEYSENIIINEIFPAPSNDSGKEEFVELYNPGEKDAALSGWILRDGSKTGKFIFPKDSVLKSDDFLVVYKKDFKFALNNSGGEKVLLFNPEEKEIDHIEYSSAKTDYAYAFDGAAWHWTSKPTPKEENDFDELLSGKIKKDETIYAGTYAKFEAKSDKKTKKFTWNFGDGHKSYLKKTKHKFEKSGTYHASLKMTGDGEDKSIEFEIKVEKFGKPKVRIVALSANPAGKDAKNEWLSIANHTKKPINLKGWSVATGSKKLYNHPIKKDFILKAGETKKLTRKDSAFSLGNKKAKIELRYPNGKVADKLKYDLRSDSISEDTIYQKDKSGWTWVETKIKIEKNTSKEALPSENETKLDENVTSDEGDIDLTDYLGKSSESPLRKARLQKQIGLIFIGSNVAPSDTVLEKRLFGINLNQASLIHPVEKLDDSLKDSLWRKVNYKLNTIIRQFQVIL